MKILFSVLLGFAASTTTVVSATTLDCNADAFAPYLPTKASITFATQVANNGTFKVSTGDIAYPTSPTNMQALCAIEVKVESSNSSAYSFGLFLPKEWNKRFLAVGNGGFMGGVNWLDMAAGVGYGFASMSTNTGHNSTNTGYWAANATETLQDWGHRAMHGSIVLAKNLTTAYYSNCAPTYSYYSGCSTGGRQGLKDIQLHPEDFDGVVAGAPAWWTDHMQPWTNWLGEYNLPNTSSHHIPTSLFPTIAAEVLRQCDTADGVADGIISSPHKCDFVPETLLCAANATNTSTCLTTPQLSTLYKIHSDYVDVNQTFVFPHLNLGSEDQWTPLLAGTTNLPHPLGYQYIQYFLGLGPNWDPSTMDYSIIQLAEHLDPGNATANDFLAMNDYFTKGGKLLHYHGLADGLISTDSSTYFYRQVWKTLLASGDITARADLDAHYRFFYVPGMQHCTGTAASQNAPWYFAGGNQAAALNTEVHSVPGFSDARHDVLLAMMDWVEKGKAPEYVVATKWHNDTIQDRVIKQRPLCMYPKEAKWDGKGDVDAAGSWHCK